MTKILGCKSKWMTLSLQPPKAEGWCNKFSAIEVDRVLWLSIFVNVCLVAGYEHCDVYDQRHVWCVWYSSWVNSLWCIAFWRKFHVWRQWRQDGVEVIKGRTLKFGRTELSGFWIYKVSRIELIISYFRRHECQIVEIVGSFLYWGLDFLPLCNVPDSRIPNRTTIMDQWSREWWRTLWISKTTLAKKFFRVFNVFGLMWCFWADVMFLWFAKNPTLYDLRMYVLISTFGSVSWA